MVPVVPRVPRYQWYHGTTWYRYLVRIFTFFFYSHISFCTCIGIGCLRMKELSMAPFAGSKTFFFFTRFFALFFNKNSWDISSLYFVEST